MENLNKNTWVVGIDIGGSHITAALVDLDNRILVPNTLIRKKINAHASAHEIIGKWSAAIEAVFMHHPLGKTKVGIAMPGPFDYANGISLMHNIDKYDALFGINIKESLSENLPISPSDICMRNDAEAFLEGEVMYL
jgi:glucokinase